MSLIISSVLALSMLLPCSIFGLAHLCSILYSPRKLVRHLLKSDILVPVIRHRLSQTRAQLLDVGTCTIKEMLERFLGGCGCGCGGIV